MQNDETKMQEQKAPEKNTDNAFIQVGEDGSPVVPPVDTKVEENNIIKKNKEADDATTLGNP